MAGLFPAVGRKQPKVRVAWWAVVAVLCFGVFIHLFQIWYMIVTTLKSGVDALSNAPELWPQHPNFSGWALIWKIATSVQAFDASLLPAPYYVFMLNSLFIAAMSILFSVPITSLAAYANSKLQRGPFARWSFIFFIGTLFVPGIVTLVPTLLLTHNFPFALTTNNMPTLPSGDPAPTLSIFNTPWACIIPGVFNAGAFLYFKAFFDTIPDSIIQAARVDGGSEFNIFRRIVLPMCVPVYALNISGIFGAVWDGSFIWQSLVLQDPTKVTTAVAIYNLEQKLLGVGTISNGGGSTDDATSRLQSLHTLASAGLTWNGLMVLGILQSIPLMIVFFITARYLLTGIRIRGLK